MSCRKFSLASGLIWGMIWIGSVGRAAEQPVSLTWGKWAATLGPSGLALSYDGEIISKGSYLQIFQPGYKGSVLGTAEAWKQGTALASTEKHTLILAAELPQGQLTYEAQLEEAAVRFTLHVSLKEGVAVGPVEYVLAHLPAEMWAGGSVEVADDAGAIVARELIPSTPVSGGLAPAGPILRFKGARRNVVVEALDFGTVYPFDGRHERYGLKQGLWPFATLPVRAGEETTSVFILRVEPPTPPRQSGKIIISAATTAKEIIVSAQATKRELFAAEELASYLAEMSGQKLERRADTGQQAPAGAILLGPPAVTSGLISPKELEAVAPDGYVVKVRGGRIGIGGPRDVGTVYGVYALLRHLGCRFYAPSCEIVPQSALLRIPDCSLADKPFYEFRHLTGNLKLGHTPKDDMMDPVALGEPGNFVHSAAYLLPYDKFHKEHPEYFALQKDGRRLSREFHGERLDVHLCLSNPEVRRICAERLLVLLEKQPERKFFSVSQGDGFAWCLCDSCKALDAVPGVEMTDRLLDYVNEIARIVAQKYPDKRILTLAYTNATSPPPQKVLPEPNVMIQYCPYPHRTDCQSHDLTCEKNRQGYEDLLGWLAKCPNNMYIFDYPTGYQNWYEPFGSFWAMKRKLDFYAQHGIRGIFYCGTPQNFRDLFIYVQSALLWHPHANVEALIKEFMEAYYGAAAPYVRAYFDFLSREVEQRPVHQQCEAANPHLVTAEYAEKALALLQQAEEAVRHDRPRLYRVQREKFCVLFGDLNARNPVSGNLAVSEEIFAQRLAEFAAIARQQRINSFIRRVSAQEWLYKIARLRVERSPFYADPVIDRLIKDPMGTLKREQQKYAQTAIPGGFRLELEGFRGAVGPQEYEYECPKRRAIWIYGVGSRNPAMWAILHLPEAPQKPMHLRLTGQDDDKPGVVPMRITINGQTIFEGPNPFPERNWKEHNFAIPPGVLKAGENEIKIATTQPSWAADQGWIMIAECVVREP